MTKLSEFRARLSLLVASALILGGAVARPAAAQSQDLMIGRARLIMNEPSYLEFGAGAFNLDGHGCAPASAAGSLEYRYGRKLFWVGPALGLLTTTRGSVLGYAGLYSDIKIAPFVITPFAGIGGYHRDTDLALGDSFVVRLSLAASYQFDDFSLIGVKFAHLSNAGTDRRDPGENEALVTYTIPLAYPF